MTEEGLFIYGIIALAVCYALIIAVTGFLTMWRKVEDKLDDNGKEKPHMPWLIDKDMWLADIQAAISEGRVFITVSLQISLKVTGYNHDTGWVTTGAGHWNQRSFMVCPSHLIVVPKEEDIE